MKKNHHDNSDVVEKDGEINFEKLTDDLGGMGRYQVKVFLLSWVCSFMAGSTAVITVFTAYVNPHRCFVPGCDQTNSSYEESFVKFSIPYNGETYNSCYSYNYSELDFKYDTQNCFSSNFDDKQISKCAGYIFDTGTMLSTIVTSFGLVCERAYLAPLGGSMYMAGTLFGSSAIGFISDKFGRKIGLLVSTLLFSLSGIACSFSPNFEFFLLFIFLAGAGAIGCFQVAFVTGVEFIGPNWRTFCGILLNIPFAFGEAFTGVIAYFLRDWKWILLTCTAPVSLLIVYQWIYPESIRWLVSQNRINEAVKLIDEVAKTNKCSSPSYILQNMTDNKEIRRNQDENYLKNSKEKSVLNILRYPNMRKRTLVLFFCWTVCAITYFGLSANSGNLSGDLFVNYILLMLIEVPSYCVAYFLLKKIGRKGTMSAIFLLAGTASLLSGLLPPELKLYIVLLSLLGKFGIAGAFGTIFVYTVELYPTEYRGIGLGTCSSIGRIGSILAPIVASLSSIYLPLPLLIFGILSFTAGLLVLLLPETLGSDLQQTLEESEEFGKGQTLLYFTCCIPKENLKLKNTHTEIEKY